MPASAVSAHSVDRHLVCPICGGERLKARWQMGFYGVVRCEGCSLTFVQNIVTSEQLSAHYASDPGEVYSDENLECLNYYYRALRELIEKHHPQRGRLLDIGCSGGWFLDVMEGWECYGNEIVASVGEIARQHHGDRIFLGFFEDYPLKQGYFDVITLQDVFDHLREPVATLERCYRMLKPGGLVVIKVHNISCLYAKICGKSFYAVVPPTHLFYYDRRTLDLLLSKTGFRLVESRFIAHRLKLKTIFMRLAKGDEASVFYRAYKGLSRYSAGDFQIRKNLHDVITVIGVK